ncbi:MAG: restriction endonuclease [Nitrososphaerales archaeon]
MPREPDKERFGAILDWKQFECFAELEFRSFGYETIRNFRVKKPRLEIDLLARSNKMAFAVDCKHWKRTVGHSTMLSISNKQIDRCRKVVSLGLVEKLIPVVLTLHDECLLVLENGVPIVPIQKISDFVLNWDSSCVIEITNKEVSSPSSTSNSFV